MKFLEKNEEHDRTGRVEEKLIRTKKVTFEVGEMCILHWMKWRTDWEKGKKLFSSHKRQKKTQERTEGFRKERKLPPGRAWGAMEGTQAKAYV